MTDFVLKYNRTAKKRQILFLRININGKEKYEQYTLRY